MRICLFATFKHLKLSILTGRIGNKDFEQIRAMGAGSIVYAIHEQEAQRWPRDLERGLRQAQDAGLKVYLSLGRYGNLFAGPLVVPSWYTFHHPKSRVMDRHGRYHDISCFNHQSFRAWLFKEIEHYLRTYPINGILLDEPRGPDITCFCSVCRALCPVVLLPQDLGQVDELAALPDLDTIGGHLFWQWLREDVSAVEKWGRTIVEVTRQHNKRSQLWLQNFNLDEAGEQELELAFGHILNAEPDEVASYYYWRNNEDPARVWQTTRRLLRRIPRRQLHWQFPLASY